MPEVRRVGSDEILKLIGELFERDSRAWITVTGMSMYPFLRGDRDGVELAKVSFGDVKRDDAVLVKRVSGEYVLHRLLKKEKDGFYIVGDAQRQAEGPLAPGQLLAVVTKIRRKGRIFDCSGPLMKTAVGLWRLLLPFRRLIFKAGGVLLRLLGKR